MTAQQHVAQNELDLTPPRAGSLRYLLLLALMTAVYFVAARAGLVLQVYYGGLSPLWPPSGIALALMWRWGLHWWPLIVFGEFAVALSLGQPLHMGLIGGVAQTFEALAAFALLRAANVQRELDRPTDVCKFAVLGALLPPLVSATLGASALRWLAQIAPDRFGSAWFTWWLGDAVGILIVTPLIIQWSRWPFPRRSEFYGWCAFTVLLLAAGGSVAMLERAHYASLFFLLLPFMIVAAAHYGAAGATSTALIMSALVLGMRVGAPADEWLTAVKIAFIGATAFAGYLVAAAFAVQRRARMKMRTEQERALVTLQSIGEGVIVLDPHGAADFMNPAAERITGWRSEEAQGLSLERFFAFTPQQPASRRTEDGEVPGFAPPALLRTRDGQRVAIECAMNELKTQAGAAAGKVVTFRDVSEEHRLKQAMLHQAQHDAVTGLYNRHAFERELRRLTMPGAPAQPCALIYLDLDQFKVVNDAYGHQAGDLLLKQLGGRLHDLVSAPSLFARTGGDEFAALLSQHSEDQVMQVAQRLRRAIEDYRFQLHGLSLSVGVSIGVAPFTSGEDRAQDILSRADVACFKAKEEGRNRVYVYRVGDLEMGERHQELLRASQLQTALQRGDFRLYWQRIVAVQPQTDEAQTPFYEVLLRLHEDGRIKVPLEFLGAAERFGLIALLDRWVIDTAFAHLAQHRAQRITISINLAAATLNDPSFFAFVIECQQRHALGAGQICFEITEKAVLNRLAQAVQVIEQLRALGFRFALDDFGSGVASFGYLDELPVDFVKLDGRFVEGMSQRPADRVVVEALARLAALKGIPCIAEWVQTQATLEELARLGVTHAQGYYLHQPEAMLQADVPV